MYHVQIGVGLRGLGPRPGAALRRASLVREIRDGKLTGVELVRRDDEERWQPLFESHVFRREVPSAGDPRDAARWRVLRAVGGHFSAFFLVSAIMYATQGHFPFWLGIWGAVLALQALKAAPTVIALVRRTRLEGGTAADPGPARTRSASALPAREGGRVAVAHRAGGGAVRALIEQRGGKTPGASWPRWTASWRERPSSRRGRPTSRSRPPRGSARPLERSAAQARESLERASRAEDRRLYERQLELSAAA